MTLLSTLLSPQLLTAVLIYVLVIVLVELLAARLQEAAQEHQVTNWLLEHVAQPLARALAITLFILAAYPALFGLAQAPTLIALLQADDGRFSALVNLAFVLSLLLPLLPTVAARPSVVLPAQGIAISSLLFHWLETALPTVNISYWPDWPTALTILVLLLLTPPLAHNLAHPLGEVLNRRYGREGFERLCYEGLLLLFQAPAILLYGLSLGRQLN